VKTQECDGLTWTFQLNSSLLKTGSRKAKRDTWDRTGNKQLLQPTSTPSPALMIALVQQRILAEAKY